MEIHIASTFLTIMNNAAMNLHVQIFVGKQAFSKNPDI